MHANSILLFDKYAKPLLERGMHVLEIGPDAFPSTFQRRSQDVALEWHTVDIHGSPKLTYPNAGEYRFPIPDQSYDVVLAANVIEHVRKPWKWMPELARLLKPRGIMIIICPVSWVYHESPVDCWRIYPEGMNALCEEAGVTVVMSRWESLETPNYRRYLPGISREWQSPKKRFGSKILGKLGFPVERSYDTITIGRCDARDGKAAKVAE